MNAIQLTATEQAAFERDGYLVVRAMAGGDECRQMETIARQHLGQLIAPVEYEIDVRYPGAPADPDAPGARTPRRLLQVYARHEAYRRWATHARVKALLEYLLPAQAGVMLSQCHHNCVMTKAPGYSSVTLWHQDNRYWSFERENLISAWLALGAENRTNGCLRVIPGSHRLEMAPERFDAGLFLKTDLPDNKQLIQRAEPVALARGDVLFFHSRLFHAAGRNLTGETKLSVVFTYHQGDNGPVRGTRSSRLPSIQL